MTQLPGREEIEAAYERIGGGVRRTPIIDLGEVPGVDARLVLKLELLQHTGSFKARGALNNVLALGEDISAVCAASGGNHAAGVAWAARRTGMTADLFVPTNATPAKIARISEYGGQVHLVDGYVKHALTACAEYAETKDVPQIHPFDTFETVCGAGTVGVEIGQQVPDAAMVVLPCGGGGLYSGTAIALRDVMRVQPVEPSGCSALASALAAGRPVDVVVGGAASDSLGAPRIGDLAFSVATGERVRPVLVTEAQISESRQWLWSRVRVLAEPGACVGLAGLLSGQVVVPAGETAVVVITGGNNETVP